MERNFAIGKDLENALRKYPIESSNNVVELQNPLNINSAKLEKKIIFAILASKQKKDRELTTTEEKCLIWVKRLYPDILRYRNLTIAIKLTQPEKAKLTECVNIYNGYDSNRKSKLKNIYRLLTFDN
tara:strand:+ start:253 stop:633 length:381 start_codon:yes stop_codon:yes gene_type:complete